MIVEGEEVFIIDYENDPAKKILYLPLRSYLALVKKEIADEITGKIDVSNKSLFFQYIKKRAFIDMDEIINNLHNCNPELSLAITDNCNLRCVYCHASAGEAHKKSTMSMDLIDSVITSYFSKVKHQKIFKINFNGGGEPTFAFHQLKYAVAKATKAAKRIGAECKFAMATNGFYNDEIRQFIVDNFSQISLSFDGPAFIHNRQRPTANGNNSFPMVYETAKYFYESNFPFAFRATISEYSMNYWEEIINFFVKEFPSKSVGFEHLNPFGRAITCNDDRIRPPSKKIFADRLIQILKYAQDKPISIMNSASTEYDIIRPIFCSNVGIPNWTVNTEGRITACGRDNAPDEFVFGKFDNTSNKIIIDQNKLKILHQMVVTNYEECKDCFCKYHCAGDCPDRRLADKSDCKGIIGVGRYVLNQKINQEEAIYGNTVSSSTQNSKSTN